MNRVPLQYKLKWQIPPYACSVSRIVHRIGATVLAAALLCGSPLSLAVPPEHSCEAHAAAVHESMRIEDLGNWEPVDDSTLLIWAPGANRAHLIRLNHPVQALAGAAILTLIDGDHDGRITACGHDEIMAGDGQDGIAGIKAIEYLSERHTAELDRQPWGTIQASLAPAREPLDPRPLRLRPAEPCAG